MVLSVLGPIGQGAFQVTVEGRRLLVHIFDSSSPSVQPLPPPRPRSTVGVCNAEVNPLAGGTLGAMGRYGTN